MVFKIAVIGGGINGVSSALCVLKDLPGVKVTIFAEKTTPDTTGDGAAGLWGPFLDGGTSDQKIVEWSKATHDLFEDYWIRGEAPDVGVCLIGVQRPGEENTPDPVWKDVVYGFRHYSPEEAQEIGVTGNLRHGWEYVTYTCECAKMIPHLLRSFFSLGGQLVRKKIADFAELTDFDVIINCSGLGAAQLAGDENVRPKRGQLVRVRAPWQKTVVMVETSSGPADRMPYCIPNTYNVGMGGTYQVDDWNTVPNEADRKYILETLPKYLPSIKDAKIVEEWVGLRPARDGGVRLERENVGIGGRTVPVIHNYGHAGSGITYFWGCAKDVRKLADITLSELRRTRSKL